MKLFSKKLKHFLILFITDNNINKVGDKDGN